MGTPSEVVDLFEQLAAMPRSTITDRMQSIREDEAVFRRGRPGGGGLRDLKVHEATNLMIALCAASATTKRKPDALETVHRVRTAVRLSDESLDAMQPEKTLHGLTLSSAKTAGEAIDSIIDDMRSGKYDKWVDNQPATVDVSFINHGSRVRLYVAKYSPDEKRMIVTVLVFRSENGDLDGFLITYTCAVDGILLQRLAEIIGPPPEDP